MDYKAGSKSIDIDSLLEGGILRHVISDETLDRHGDIVISKGWDLEDYLKNPVILWAHDHRTMPIGKCTSIEVKRKRLIAEGDYPSASVYEFGNTAFRLAALDYIRGVSVGFMPKKYELLDEEDPWGGVKMLEQTLWEYSVVPVPANPNALRLAADQIGGFKAIKSWAEMILDTRETKSIGGLAIDVTPNISKSLVDALGKLMNDLKSFSVGAPSTLDSREEEIEGDLNVADEVEVIEEEPRILTTDPVLIHIDDNGNRTEIKGVAEIQFDGTLNLLGATADHDEEIAIRIIEREDPVVLRIVDEPTITVDESDIKQCVAIVMSKITGRLIDNV